MTTPGSFIPVSKGLCIKWKAFAARLFLFVVILILTLEMIHSHPLLKSSDALKFDEIFHPQTRAEIMILGDSRGQTGINPFYLEDLSKKVYNFSFSDAKLAYVDDLYGELLSRYYPKPKVIIYSVVPADVFLKGRDFEQDISYFPWKIFEERVFKSRNRKALLINRFELFQNRPELLTEIFADMVEKSNHMYKFYKGFYSMHNIYLIEKSVKHIPLKPAASAQIIRFQALIRKWKGSGIKVVLVQPPVFMYSAIENIWSREYEQCERAMELVAKQEGVPYLNYNGALGKKMNENRKLFRNVDHLNESGNATFSQMLKTDLPPVLIAAYKSDLSQNSSYEDYCFLGTLCLLKGRAGEAREYYRKALAMDAQRAEAYIGLGRVLDLENNATAERYYLKALEKNPRDIAGRVYLGNLLAKWNRFREAGHSYLAALELDPSDASVYHDLGNVFYEIKNYEKARECYQKAGELNPIFNEASARPSLK